jgi:hypothetical protein
VVSIGSKQISSSRGNTMAACRYLVESKKRPESGASERGSTVRNPARRQGVSGENHAALKARLYGIRRVTVRNPYLSLSSHGGSHES